MSQAVSYLGWPESARHEVEAPVRDRFPAETFGRDRRHPAGPCKSDPPLEVRRILVHSTGNAKGQQRARDKRLAKAREDLDKLQHSAGGRCYNTAEKIAARIGVITKTRRVSSCLRTEITTDDTGRPAQQQDCERPVRESRPWTAHAPACALSSSTNPAQYGYEG
jgi:hypothetical protein